MQMLTTLKALFEDDSERSISVNLSLLAEPDSGGCIEDLGDGTCEISCIYWSYIVRAEFKFLNYLANEHCPSTLN